MQAVGGNPVILNSIPMAARILSIAMPYWSAGAIPFDPAVNLCGLRI